MVAAVAIGGVVTAGSSIAGSSIAAGSAKKAAKNSNALQAQIYGQNSANLSPFIQEGRGATDQLGRLLGIGDSATGTASNPYSAVEQQQGAIQAFQQSAPYQAEFKAGQDAVTAALGSKGLLDSGAALKGLQSYGDQFLSGKLNTYIGQLQNLSGVGLTAGSALAGVGQNYANAVSTNNTNAANAEGNAALSSANSINSAVGSALTGYGLLGGLNSLGSSYGGSSSSGGLRGNWDW